MNTKATATSSAPRLMRMVLASSSPRRHLLLTQAGIKFETMALKVSEIPNKSLSFREQAIDLAQQKVQAAVSLIGSKMDSQTLILGADTMVVCEGRQYGKPLTHQQASEFLNSLSGRVHDVITGIYLFNPDQNRAASGAEITQVEFHQLEEKDIQGYVMTEDPMDKAGAYGIQGAARKFVKSINGPIDNVMGLPVSLLLALCSKNDWAILSG